MKKDEELKRKEFQKILLELSSEQNLLQDDNSLHHFYTRLESLYYASGKEQRFRHFYSDIFSVLSSIKEDDSLGNIAVLGQNIGFLYKKYKPTRRLNGNVIDIEDSLQKLYDHVSLDIARIQYSDKGDYELSFNTLSNNVGVLKTDLDNALKEQSRLSKNLEDYQKKQKDISKQIEDQKRQIEKQKIDFITILGIFAAVVLAFTGGMSFSSSVLQNIGQASIYRIVIVAIVLGIVLFNTIAFLLVYILKIGETSDRISRPHFSIVIVNFALILCLALVAIWCHTDYLERENGPLPVNANTSESINSTVVNNTSSDN
jgi:hypothetical protein